MKPVFILKLIFLIGIFSTTGVKTFCQTNNTQLIVSEVVVKERLKQLSKTTPIALDYNKLVQAYIDAYTIRRRDHFQRIIERSNLYFPLFEEYLDKYNLPHELKYLAIVESALDPKAKSTSGAMGLWQFLYHASRMFDLQVNTYVDERCDPVKSTEAACKYLQYLYRNFNDWHLALAAYNVGIGEVKKAIEKSGGKRNFWELSPYLPQAARSYVPAFIAACYAMNNYQLYNFSNHRKGYLLSDLDTVLITKSLGFEQISKNIDISIDDLALLNPGYSKNFIPVTNVNATLVLPAIKIPLFTRQLSKMKEEQVPLAFDWGNNRSGQTIKVTHQVKRGEYFHKIAIDYRCKVEDIMKWNNLKSQQLSAGQSLTIYTRTPANKFFFIRNEIDNRNFDLTATEHNECKPNDNLQLTLNNTPTSDTIH
jgi:membrane-bound lytic murein transglycosylase D